MIGGASGGEARGEAGVAALRMYDLDELRSAYDELWTAIANRLDDAPSELTWTGVPGREWRDPDLVLGQTCGWPLVTDLRDEVTVVGAFHHRLDVDGRPPVDGGRESGGEVDVGNRDAAASGVPTYRSVVVAAQDRPLAAFAGEVAAVNGRDSLSGWVSLGAAVAAVADAADVAGASSGRSGGTGEIAAAFFGGILETGSHQASVQAVQARRAAVASIDAVSWTLFERHRPGLTDGLVIVGRGPVVPTLPLITRRIDPRPLRAAISAAVADPATAACRAQLLIAGFTPLELADYDRIMSPLR